ncbi:MAG: DUF6377 domain-containing protein [Staphylococcus sp.]|nr:DUF6377 domain-containing protein [Staphylococcus sp.]
MAVKAYIELGLLMEGLNSDSSVISFSRGFQLASDALDSVTAQRALIYRARVMGNLYATPEAINDLHNVVEDGLYSENNLLFCEVGRDLYYTIAELYEGTQTHESYILPGLSLARQYQSLLSPETTAYKLNRAFIYFAEKNYTMFISQLSEIVKDISSDDPLYSMCLTALGGRYFLDGHLDEAIRYLSLAAIHDIREANRTNTALIRLGEALYESGDIVRSHNYLSVALEDALAANAKTNCQMISSALMPVSHTLKTNAYNRQMLLLCLVVSLVFAVVLLAYLYRVKKRKAQEIERVKHQLADVNKSKDTYISEFMNLCSSYMECLDDFNRMCRRKITAGQTEDLLNFIKSEKIIEEQRQKFDDIFDDSFIQIYPTFIADVNKLLMPDKQIVNPGPRVLTTELRVLAFTRLGIDDTAQVARFLGVSLNTIYTYRNKLRNKAISRETFDADVMKIGVIS